MFIPLMVYEWYYTIGQCKSNNDNEWAGKLTCHEGYVFAAILSGVAQTVALISALYGVIWSMLEELGNVIHWHWQLLLV